MLGYGSSGERHLYRAIWRWMALASVLTVAALGAGSAAMVRREPTRITCCSNDGIRLGQMEQNVLFGVSKGFGLPGT